MCDWPICIADLQGVSTGRKLVGRNSTTVSIKKEEEEEEASWLRLLGGVKGWGADFGRTAFLVRQAAAA